jgi:hypothetical protein
MRVIVILITLICIGSLNSCKQKEESKGHTLTMVAFGPTDSVTNQNKGFGSRFYCYINFETDSVLIREWYIFEDSIFVKTGFLKGIKKNNSVLNVIQIFSSIDSNGITLGTIYQPSSDIPPPLYDGLEYFVEYNNHGNIQHFYTSKITIESLNELMKWLSENGELKNSNISIDEANIISPIVNRADFKLIPPPSIKAIIKFIPPKVSEPKADDE